MSLAKVLLWVLNFLMLVSCTSAVQQRNELDFLMVDGAYDVRRDALGNPAVVQVSYKIERKYPDKAISAPVIQRLEAAGWRRCPPAGSDDWNYFRDLTAQPNRYVHQYEAWFTNDNKLLSIAMMYFSSADRSRSSKDGPEHAQQHVVAISYDLANDAVQAQLAEAAKRCKGP